MLPHSGLNKDCHSGMHGTVRTGMPWTHGGWGGACLRGCTTGAAEAAAAAGPAGMQGLADW